MFKCALTGNAVWVVRETQTVAAAMHTISNILGVMSTQVQLFSDTGEPLDLRSDIDEEVVLVLLNRERMAGE